VDIRIECHKRMMERRINREKSRWKGKSMESTWELAFQLKHNRGNISDNIHTMSIQSKQARAEKLLCNQRKRRAIENMK
jgi:hypothetical protein